MKTKRMFVCSFFAVLFFAVTAVNVLADINDDLYSAVNRNDVGAVKNLLAMGADPNARCENWAGKRDFTPLYAAAEEGNVEIVKLLLDKGGDVNAKCPMDITPLMTAANHGKKDTVILLLGENPDVNAVNTSGQTALLYAVESSMTDDSDTVIAGALLEKGADPNQARDGWTPLMFAAARNKPGIVKLLIAKGADVNSSKDGNTALTFAESREYAEIVKMLKAAGAK